MTEYKLVVVGGKIYLLLPLKRHVLSKYECICPLASRNLEICIPTIQIRLNTLMYVDYLFMRCSHSENVFETNVPCCYSMKY